MHKASRHWWESLALLIGWPLNCKLLLVVPSSLGTALLAKFVRHCFIVPRLLGTVLFLCLIWPSSLGLAPNVRILTRSAALSRLDAGWESWVLSQVTSFVGTNCCWALLLAFVLSWSSHMVGGSLFQLLWMSLNRAIFCSKRTFHWHARRLIDREAKSIWITEWYVSLVWP